MSIPVVSTPPDSRTSYVLPQLAGEKITLPGWKGVFRILASSNQTNGGLAVMAGASVLADAPGFHWHEEAHDIFMIHNMRILVGILYNFTCKEVDISNSIYAMQSWSKVYVRDKFLLCFVPKKLEIYC